MILKSNNAYKSIGEVAKILNLINTKKGKLNTHTIRFWEKEFKQIKPKILNGNRRYYNNDTIEILKKVKYLLKDRGMTINGVKKSSKF
ncbi:MerR family transcriptional regulator [Candidatus Pelagibacter sp.]|nr:MerR family transcriptional regulator [Candidatus Pelagibacter sp.]